MMPNCIVLNIAIVIPLRYSWKIDVISKVSFIGRHVVIIGNLHYTLI